MEDTRRKTACKGLTPASARSAACGNFVAKAKHVQQLEPPEDNHMYLDASAFLGLLRMRRRRIRHNTRVCMAAEAVFVCSNSSAA